MNKWLKNSYMGLIYFFLYCPIAIVILLSFNNTRYSLIWHGFTLNWYNTLFADTDIITVTFHSLTIGFIASTVATLLGLTATISLFRYRFFGKQLLSGLIFILIITPDIVIGIALLLFYNTLHLPLGFWSLLFAHISFCLPFVVVVTTSRINTLDKHLFEAAKDLGATEFTIFKKIIIPLMLPAIIASWLISFTLSIDDVIISYFVSGPNYSILPLKIYSMVRLGIKPEVNALSTILFIFTLIMVLLTQFALRKKQ